MRYAVAAIAAVAFAAAAVVLVGTPVASRIMARWMFSDVDEAARLHVLVFAVSAVLGLFVGWAFGWWLGGSFERRA